MNQETNNNSTENSNLNNESRRIEQNLTNTMNSLVALFKGPENLEVTKKNS